MATVAIAKEQPVVLRSREIRFDSTEKMICYNIILVSRCWGGPRLLIDWEMAGQGRMFEIEVPDIDKAHLFYRDVLGARETSHRETRDGELIRLGLAIGPIAFAISSEAQHCADRPSIALLAQDLGTSFAAVIVWVEDPDEIADRAVMYGGKVLAISGSNEAAIITDPFGGHWALLSEQSASTPLFSGRECVPKCQTRH